MLGAEFCWVGGFRLCSAQWKRHLHRTHILESCKTGAAFGRSTNSRRKFVPLVRSERGECVWFGGSQQKRVIVVSSASKDMVRTSLDDRSTTGEFKRIPSSYLDVVSREEGAEFPPEAGRYHLYISYACPWASRCYMFLKLKGLEHAIGLTIVKPKWEKTKEGDDHHGWVFATHDGEEPDADSDHLNGAKSIRDLYDTVNPEYTGRYTVPVFWDTKKKTIVNNESSEITKFLNFEFNDFAKHPEVDLYPQQLQSQIEDVHTWTYNTFNNGVYRAGFATQQTPYDNAVKDVFDTLDRCESILSKQRYIAGNQLTEADIRLFVTLIRFDEVYVVHFKCNKKFINQYPNIFNYTKDIYQLPGISDTVNMYHIKKHYFGSHPMINPSGVIPAGQGVDFSAKHDRDRFS